VSKEFEAMQEEEGIAENPLKEVFTTYFVEFFVLFLVYIAPAVVYYSNIVWIPTYLDSSISSVDDTYSYDMQLVSGIISIAFYAASGWLADRFGLWLYFKVTTAMCVAVVFVCYLIIGLSSTVWVLSVFQVLLAFCAFGTPAFLYWAMFWCPVPSIRNSIMAISYNLGMALFVSTQFDVETYLADLDEYWGCIFAGLHIIFILSLSIGAAYWAENYHTWERHLQMERANLAENAVVEDVHEEEDVSVAPAV